MKDAESVPGTGTTQTLAASRAVFRRLVRSPALWLFIVVYVVALVLFISAGGTMLDLLSLLIPAFYCLFIAILVLPLTAGAPPAAWEEAGDASRPRPWVQLAITALFVALYIAFTVVIFTPGSVPGLGPFLLQHSASVASLVAVSLPVVGLLSLVILRLLGVGFREMGVGPGYHTFRVAAIGCSVPVGVLIVFLALGHFTLPALGYQLGRALFIAALPEEALFRGVLVTRLVRFLGQQWGIALAVGLFALVHLETDLYNDGSLLLALTDMVLSQAAIGIVLVVVFVRTRSLLPGIILHTIMDTYGSLIRF
jgi:membrane protease YdiL (CAAX protease family)